MLQTRAQAHWEGGGATRFESYITYYVAHSNDYVMYYIDFPKSYITCHITEYITTFTCYIPPFKLLHNRFIFLYNVLYSKVYISCKLYMQSTGCQPIPAVTDAGRAVESSSGLG